MPRIENRITIGNVLIIAQLLLMIWGAAVAYSTLSQAVASTSGTAIDFTGIPSWVRRVTVMFENVSTNGTAQLLVQLGDSGGVENSGYAGAVSALGVGVATASYSSGILIGFGTGDTAAAQRNGAIIIQKLTGNTWSAFGSLAVGGVTCITSGTKPLSDSLDRVRITTATGADTFDAGTVNVTWE